MKKFLGRILVIIGCFVLSLTSFLGCGEDTTPKNDVLEGTYKFYSVTEGTSTFTTGQVFPDEETVLYEDLFVLILGEDKSFSFTMSGLGNKTGTWDVQAEDETKIDLVPTSGSTLTVTKTDEGLTVQVTSTRTMLLKKVSAKSPLPFAGTYKFHALIRNAEVRYVGDAKFSNATETYQENYTILAINADNTFTITTAGEPMSGSWETTQNSNAYTLTANSNSLTATVCSEYLTMPWGEDTLILKRA